MDTTASCGPRGRHPRREFDVIFDFSASPVGGGLKRLLAYVDFFAPRRGRVLFLVHPHTEEHVAGKTAQYEVVRRNPLARLWFDPRFVSRYGGRTRWFFSYGIPIYGKVGDHNWLHVSNSLPFGLLGLTLDIRAFAGNFLLRERFVRYADNCSVVSGESEFTLDIYRKTTGWRRRFVVLRNGMEAFASGSGKVRLPEAITVGTSRYKRLDRTCAVFERMQATRRLEKLLIVGNLESIPFWVRRKPYVECLGILPREQVLRHMRQAQVFISTSEIENSSNAVLEALVLGGTVVLSDIPSHRELIGSVAGQALDVDGLRCLELDASVSALDLSQYSWDKTIFQMLSTMASLSRFTRGTNGVETRDWSAMDNERRSSPRYQVKVDVGMQTESNFYTGLTQDLSGGGIFVATNQIRQVGERIKVLLTLPGQAEAFEILTEVRWVRDASLGRSVDDVGMGLRFLQMSPGAKKAVTEFLSQRESLFFDED